MTTAKSGSLFTDLSVQEAANINGAWGHFTPVYYCYPVSSWGGSNSGSSVSQSVNVNVLIED